MRKFRIILNLFIAGILVLFFIQLCATSLINRTLPSTTGEIRTSSVSDTSRIFRDKHHIPHIYSKNIEDLYFSQGFAAAQDRIWQMDLYRLAAQGRLSEIYGHITSGADSLIRFFHLSSIADFIYSRASPESKRIYEAYSKGVNAWISQNEKRLPVEYQWLNIGIKFWKPKDCILVYQWYQWASSAEWTMRIWLGLIDAINNNDAFTASSYARLLEKMQRLESLGLAAPLAPDYCLGIPGEKTITGKPFLAAALHNAPVQPSPWHENHLMTNNINVHGFSLPGFPNVLMGQNDSIAWVSAADWQAAFSASELKALKDTEFITWQTDTILVKNRDPVIFQIPEFNPDYGIIIPLEKGHFVYQWKGLNLFDANEHFHHLNKAASLKQAAEAVPGLKYLARNIILSNNNGDLVQFLSGSASFIYNEPFILMPADSSFLYSGLNRHLTALINHSDRTGINHVRSILSDTRSPFAEDVLTIIMPVLNDAEFHLANETAVIADLNRWDFQMRAGSREALIFEKMLNELCAELFYEKWSDYYFPLLMNRRTLALSFLHNQLKTESAPSEFSNETREKIQKSFSRAIISAEEKYGPNPLDWKWSSAHDMMLRHTLGRDILTGILFQNRVMPVNGSEFTILGSGSSWKMPFRVTWAPSARLIINMHQRDNSEAALLTGQSGNIISPYFSNQLAEFFFDTYHPVLINRERIIQSGFDMLTLIPEE